MPKKTTSNPRRVGRKTRTVLSVLLYTSGSPTKYVAQLAGIEPSYLSSIASGKLVPADDVLESIASVLDLQTRSPRALLETVKSRFLYENARLLLAVD